MAPPSYIVPAKNKKWQKVALGIGIFLLLFLGPFFVKPFLRSGQPMMDTVTPIVSDDDFLFDIDGNNFLPESNVVYADEGRNITLPTTRVSNNKLRVTAPRNLFPSGTKPNAVTPRLQVTNPTNPTNTSPGTSSGTTSTALLITDRTHTPTATSAAISWITNRAADTRLSYGISSSFGSSLPANTTLSTTHQMTMPGLTPSTVYYYRVESRDTNGNSALQDGTFATPSANGTTDTTPPVISSIEVRGITSTTATVQWVTNEVATSRVEYGTTQSFERPPGLPPFSDLVRGHSVTLTNLNANTTYLYRVTSADANGNSVNSVPTPPSFKTLDANQPPSSELTIISGPRPIEVKTTSATIQWATNVPASTEIACGVGTASSTCEHDNIIQSLVQDHTVRLINLKPGQEYFYKVTSRDAGGRSVSKESTFTTLKEGQNPAKHQITSGPKVESDVLGPRGFIVDGTTAGPDDCPPDINCPIWEAVVYEMPSAQAPAPTSTVPTKTTTIGRGALPRADVLSPQLATLSVQGATPDAELVLQWVSTEQGASSQPPPADYELLVAEEVFTAENVAQAKVLTGRKVDIPAYEGAHGLAIKQGLTEYTKYFFVVRVKDTTTKAVKGFSNVLHMRMAWVVKETAGSTGTSGSWVHGLTIGDFTKGAEVGPNSTSVRPHSYPPYVWGIPLVYAQEKVLLPTTQFPPNKTGSNKKVPPTSSPPFSGTTPPTTATKSLDPNTRYCYVLSSKVQGGGPKGDTIVVGGTNDKPNCITTSNLPTSPTKPQEPCPPGSHPKAAATSSGGSKGVAYRDALSSKATSSSSTGTTSGACPPCPEGQERPKDPPVAGSAANASPATSVESKSSTTLGARSSSGVTGGGLPSHCEADEKPGKDDPGGAPSSCGECVPKGGDAKKEEPKNKPSVTSYVPGPTKNTCVKGLVLVPGQSAKIFTWPTGSKETNTEGEGLTRKGDETWFTVPRYATSGMVAISIQFTQEKDPGSSPPPTAPAGNPGAAPAPRAPAGPTSTTQTFTCHVEVRKWQASCSAISTITHKGEAYFAVSGTKGTTNADIEAVSYSAFDIQKPEELQNGAHYSKKADVTPAPRTGSPFRFKLAINKDKDPNEDIETTDAYTSFREYGTLTMDILFKDPAAKKDKEPDEDFAWRTSSVTCPFIVNHPKQEKKKDTVLCSPAPLVLGPTNSRGEITLGNKGKFTAFTLHGGVTAKYAQNNNVDDLKKLVVMHNALIGYKPLQASIDVYSDNAQKIKIATCHVLLKPRVEETKACYEKNSTGFTLKVASELFALDDTKTIKFTSPFKEDIKIAEHFGSPCAVNTRSISCTLSKNSDAPTQFVGVTTIPLCHMTPDGEECAALPEMVGEGSISVTVVADDISNTASATISPPCTLE